MLVRTFLFWLQSFWCTVDIPSLHRPPFFSLHTWGLVDNNCVAKVLLMSSALQGLRLAVHRKISTSVDTEVVFYHETLHAGT